MDYDPEDELDYGPEPDWDTYLKTSEGEDGIIAEDCGFAVEKAGSKILFRDKGQLKFLHLSWFLGVTSLIFFIFMIVSIVLGNSEIAKKDSAIFFIVSVILFTITIIPTIASIYVYLKRRKRPAGSGAIKYIADLGAHELLDSKKRTLCRFSSMRILIKSAWDNYLTGDDTYYDQIVMKWGAFRSAKVFKSTNEHLAKELAERLRFEMLH